MMRATEQPRTLPEPLPQPEQGPPPAPSVTPPQDDGVRWLALLMRQSFLLFVRGVELRYGLKRSSPD